MFRQDYFTLKQTRAFSYPTYEEVYRHVSSIQLLKIVGGIVWLKFTGSEHLLVVSFNAKELPSTLKMWEILKCWCPNSRL